MSIAGTIAPLCIAMGDPAGIGPEVIAKAWAARHERGLMPFFVIGEAAVLEARGDISVRRISSPSQAAACFADALPCIDITEGIAIKGGISHPGHPTMRSAQIALAALEAAIAYAKSGAASALVTGPVSKSALYQIGFTHPGQTEFVADRCGIAAHDAVMMLAGPALRVVPITIHVALEDVPAALTVELILARVRTTARDLSRYFGIARPRLVVTGLNPHAGEDGALGREEQLVITPAIQQLQHEGYEVRGPLAADTLFHARARAGYDAALCMYHDQALIPIKTLDFDEGVNITLGLPVIRTSPDHGTAFDIAGENKAHPGAMIAAIRMAAQAADNLAKWNAAQ